MTNAATHLAVRGHRKGRRGRHRTTEGIPERLVDDVAHREVTFRRPAFGLAKKSVVEHQRCPHTGDHTCAGNQRSTRHAKAPSHLVDARWKSSAGLTPK